MSAPLSRQDWADVVRKSIYPSVRSSTSWTDSRGSHASHSGETVRGMLAEGWAFARLEAAMVPYVRSYEGAPVDGALIKTPPQGWANRREHQRLSSVAGLNGVLFDVKSFGYQVDKQRRKYGFRAAGQSKPEKNAAFIILVSESVEDYLAIVPSEIWNSATDIAQGDHALIVQIHLWCYPFMVHVGRLAEAARSIVTARSGQWYKNPTTGVVLTGWIPHTTAFPSLGWQPMLYPDRTTTSGIDRTRRSGEAVQKLWTEIDGLGQEPLIPGIRVETNPIAPLLCDFLLHVDGLEEPLRIEHKYRVSSRGGGARWFYDTYRASPFYKHRIWHFLISQTGDDEDAVYHCLGRHEVNDAWADGANFGYGEEDDGVFVFKGSNALLRLLLRVRELAHEAIQEANKRLALCPPQDLRADLLVSSSADLMLYSDSEEELSALVSTEETLEEEADPTGEESSGHANGLPWLLLHLLDQSFQAQDVLILPVDPGHPIANHIAVAHKWDAHDNEIYTSSRERKLPRHAYDASLQELDCIPLRLSDWSGGAYDVKQNGLQNYPASIRRFYWQKPVKGFAFWHLASTLKRAYAPVFDSYMLIPSGDTTQFDGDFREPLTGEGELRCKRYIYREAIENVVLPHPGKASRTHVYQRTPMTDGFMAYDADTGKTLDPLEYVIKVSDHTPVRHLQELFYGTSADMSIVQPGSETRRFTKREYICKVREFNQAGWDYGVYRKPGKIVKAVKNSDATAARGEQ
ncbi:hypothetical protein LTR17_022026 [Elasticomyces elasticus]|nr:hypothetical protein LTR17_022026 [Elasticomyces elasticus]